MPETWDRYAINAEVRRRGMTLTGIAIDAGLHESACRQGVIGANRRGAEAIADALDIPFRELFPQSYSRGRHNERNASAGRSEPTSQNGQPAMDSAGTGRSRARQLSRQA